MEQQLTELSLLKTLPLQLARNGNDSRKIGKKSLSRTSSKT